MKRERILPEAPTGTAATIGYRYSLTLLTTIYLFNFVDRQVVNIVAEPIKTEFGLADWQLGAMTGLSFAVLYTLCGFPFARWAERGDRSRIISIAVVSWSIMTTLCGIAQNFTQFLLARIGVGLGEAGCTPPAHSLISDIVPVARRASALALYSMGAPMGQLLGMAMGGFVAAQWGWRAVFFVAGIPGLALALLALFTLPEPRRAAVRDLASAGVEPEGFWRILRLFLTNRSFMLVCAGGAAASFVFYGLSSFYASFFLRNHTLQLNDAAQNMGLQPIGFLGLALGLSGGVAGIGGAIIGGRVADAWARRNDAAHVLLPALCTSLAAPLLFAAMFVPGIWASIVLIAAASALNSSWTGAAYAAALGLAPARSRATASALMMFVFNIVGLGLGPLCVGLLSDAFAPSLGAGGGLRLGMACGTLAGLGAAACFWAARKRLHVDAMA
ncbi:hypothetical protein ASG11_04545 [Sphingomonas sp. Leaf357]|uniref:spinster family MFS transporter n=1 Tax=Sphingomonas sp. Leaf357 TaxID=1736350 RepID=UPI0006F482C5|nr:MFS transporter [Sphingomonas sp. Leaf357]KQS03609.1 hypothetical protein ASG11_04545 [Sphingomonas sp. Leaf357]